MRFTAASLASSFLLLGAAVAQLYAGDVISAYLPTIPGTEVAFFKIPDPSGLNNNLTLINYYAHGTDGGRIKESNIQRAVITIHGLLRDPWNYANDANGDVDVDSVAVMAPYFPNGDDKGFAYPWTNGLKANQGSTTNALVWSGSQWIAGGNNQYPYTSTNTSTFFVLDTLVQYFNNATLFPNLKQIVLVGHSAGGQTLDRYATVGPDLGLRVPLTYWIGNPNSYAWLTEDRPLSTAACPIFDNYREGYTNFTEYPMTYGAGIVAQGREALIANYKTKQKAYARALLDHGDDSDSCAPETTGADRHERLFFFIDVVPPTCDDPTSSNCDTLDLIPVSHDNGQMFKSAAGQARLFTDNFYGNHTRSYDFGYPRLQPNDDPYPNPALVSTPGPSDYKVYAGNMTYQGCWANQQPVTPPTLPVLLYSNSTNTREACTSACYNGGYTISGVQNSTQCYCGNAMNSQSAVLVVDSSCRLPCSGNSAEVCGAPTRLSIFAPGYPAFD